MLCELDFEAMLELDNLELLDAESELDDAEFEWDSIEEVGRGLSVVLDAGEGLLLGGGSDLLLLGDASDVAGLALEVEA